MRSKIEEKVSSSPLSQMRKKMAIYVFSYNRARLLDHSLETTKKCMSGFSTFVFDDGSTDQATLAVLEKWRAHFEVHQTDTSAGEKKTGGLYPNMSSALRHASDHGYTYALFTQDDMQFIRPFDIADSHYVERYFDSHEKVIQLLVHFIKRPEQHVEISDLWHLDANGIAYLRTNLSINAKACFCAGGIFDVTRTIETLGQFELSEAENSEKLREKGYYYGYTLHPFISFMPAPISYRGKRRSFEHRIYEFLGGAGFHPIRQMSKGKIDELRNRNPAQIPFAEDFLTCPSAPAPDNWAAGGGDYLVMARGGWRANLLRAITQIKDVLKSIVSAFGRSMQS